MKRRHAISLLALGAALPAGTALAQDWCDVDPAVPIKTVGNRAIVLYVINSGPTVYRSTLAGTHPDYTATATSDGGIDVVMTIDFDSVGQTPSPRLASEVWTGPQRGGTHLSSQSGTFGSTVVHRFRLGDA